MFFEILLEFLFQINQSLLESFSEGQWKTETLNGP